MSLNGDRQIQPQSNSWLNLEIYVKSNHPQLLQGLDQWLQLDLISEAQVKKICRQNLSCALPEIKVEEVNSDSQLNISPTPVNTLVKTAPKTNIITQLWQNFLDELSIRWLLFLGIFLVIISSGVLAASQWNNVPRVAQYLILLIYTLSFWGMGFWLNKQDNLKLTSQTLSAIAILLVPINFWAISRFSLGKNILEWITIFIAFITLTAIIYLQSQLRRHNQTKFFLALFLALSYLHLGWHFTLLPEIAVYGGIFTLILLHYQVFLTQAKYPSFDLFFLLAAWLILLAREILIGNLDIVYNYLLAIALFGWFLATIDLTIKRKDKLCLTQQEQQQATRQNHNLLTVFILVVSLFILWGTWLLSFIEGMTAFGIFRGESQLVNAVVIHISICALAIHLFMQSLTIYWKKSDLNGIFWLGLYTAYISKELIPLNLRTEALNLAATVSKTNYFPESVLGVTLFPYLILFILVATWLYRRQKTQLALHTEFLTLLLGIFFTSLSFSNPTWRSLNLLFSTFTLGYVAWCRQPIRKYLIYATHLLGLVTIINGLLVILSNSNQLVWNLVLTALTVIEWGIYCHRAKQPRIKVHSNYLSIFRQSSWYFGLLLAIFSYIYFLSQVVINPTPSSFRWGLVWLFIPGMLTLVAKYTRKIQQRRLTTWLSCTSLITAQLLVWGQPETRFIGLFVAIGLMLANAYHLRRTAVTIIHIGFGLSFIPSLLYGYITYENWLVVGAIAILGLYKLRQYLEKSLDTPKLEYMSQRNNYGILGVGVEIRNFKLIRKYIKATDYWAIALTIIEITILSVMYFNITELAVYTQYLVTTILITSAIIWRYRQQPNNLSLYAVVWLIELLVAGLIIVAGGDSLTLAIANIILGLLALVLVRWLATTSLAWGKLNLAYIPLIYGIFGILPRLTHFNAYTGLLTLGAAIILINTNFDKPNTNLITKYIALIGISIGIYEIVIYQMLLSSGGSAADGLTILALVAAAIAFSYRLGAWWYSQRQQIKIFQINLPQFILIAHIHWAISSILKIIAASIAIESATPRLTPVSIATSFCLGAYALIQGKDHSSSQQQFDQTNSKLSDWWVYVGLVEIAATLVYSRLIINKLSFFDPLRVIFTCAIALAIYQIPWKSLGWRATPWQRTALIIPALMAMITAEDISYISLLCTAIFYFRIAYSQKNIRWSYVSLGFINWGIIKLVWQYNTELIWLAGIISLSILYIAQFDPHLQSHRQQRHYLRLLGNSILCVTALSYQDLGIIPSVISLSLMFIGLGLKIRAFLFTGTITLILTIIYQLVILVLTYSFLKWIVGLLAGICSIAIAAGFEKQRQKLTNQLKIHTEKTAKLAIRADLSTKS